MNLLLEKHAFSNILSRNYKRNYEFSLKAYIVILALSISSKI